MSAIPITVLRITSAFAIWFCRYHETVTPAMANGPEAANSHNARCPCTVPRRRWRHAPNDLKIAP